jgi:hypothetical protein
MSFLHPTGLAPYAQRMKILLLILLTSITRAFAGNEAVESLYQSLKTDFESKHYFFNHSINDFRDGVISPFLQEMFKADAINNARPLTQKQITKLPDAYFLERKPFFLAMAGRERLIKAGKIKNHPILAVVDFSRHSKQRRMFIMDVERGEVLVNTYTSHAYATDSDGDGYAEAYSNVSGSEKTSVGFMSSDVTYYGSYGYSLRLRGHDPKLNSNVLSRAVVVHGFGGMDVYQASWGSISTSQGCLMLSTNESGRFWGMEDKSMLQIVIGILKPGSLIFNYTDQADLKLSEWIKSTDAPVEEAEYEQLTTQEEMADHLPGAGILPANVD